VTSDLKLLYEGKHICPVCSNNSMWIRQYSYEAPKAGVLLLMVFECESCGYRIRDVKPFEEGKPIKIILKVENEEDLRSILYRSPYANVIIPELGVEALSKEAYQGVITTVEGLLEILLDNMGELCENNGCQDIEKAKKGELPFTLIIEDQSGLSYVESKKASVTQL